MITWDEPVNGTKAGFLGFVKSKDKESSAMSNCDYVCVLTELNAALPFTNPRNALDGPNSVFPRDQDYKYESKIIYEITLFSLRYNIQLLSGEIRVFIHIKDKV